ncbi:MAG: hypothetical protein K2Y37_07025 [Pirellulales bacterium]|nr:hypothetical protein [Pirellulales bacterium]
MTDIIATTQPFTLFMVAQFTVIDAQPARLVGDTGGNTVAKLNGTPVSNISAQVNLGGSTPAALANPAPLDTTNPFILVWQWVSGTGVSLSFNGATPTTTSGTGTLFHPGEFYLPSGQPNFKCRYDLFELIVCSGSSAGLDAATQAQAGVYLAAR